LVLTIAAGLPAIIEASKRLRSWRHTTPAQDIHLLLAGLKLQPGHLCVDLRLGRLRLREAGLRPGIIRAGRALRGAEDQLVAAQVHVTDEAAHGQ
jgi:hypothetical protein